MVCFGLLSPMVLGFIEFGILFDHRSSLAPWRFLALCLIIVPVLYGLTDRTQFRWDKRSGVTGALSVLLFAVSVAGSVFCYKHHVCMGGHLADDAPDLTSAGYAFDSIWAAGLVISIFAMAKARSPLALGFAGAAAFLISYRLVFGSFGGMYTLPI